MTERLDRLVLCNQDQRQPVLGVGEAGFGREHGNKIPLGQVQLSRLVLLNRLREQFGS
jgi:hypothetical protein